MAISATLQIWDANTGNFLTQNLKDIYTVLNLDYTVERDCDKTGRPSGGASISVINVIIRATKEKGAPFHEWIQSPDKLMDGVVKIYDSEGKVSSVVQGYIGADTQEDEDVPDDMNQTSEDDHEQDIYDEMSHEDLVEYAQDHGIKYDSGDSDDDLRKKIRGKTDTSEPSKVDQMKSSATSGAKSVASEVAKRALECARSLSFENAYLISLRELFENNPDSNGELDSDYPWKLELGIKPKTVKVSGEQIGTKALGGETKFDLY